MIGNRSRQLELVNLALCWALAVSIQLLLCNLISSLIWLYVFKEDFLSGYRIIEWLVSIIRDRLFWGFCLGLFWGWRTLLLDGQIELETALYLTGVVGVFLGLLPLMVGIGHPNWVLPIFFMECAPLCAFFWQLLHLGSLRFVNWKTKRAGKAKAPEQALAEETNDLKKEDKPVEKQSVLPKEPPSEPTQKSFWRID